MSLSGVRADQLTAAARSEIPRIDLSQYQRFDFHPFKECYKDDI